jgi:uncharacterized YccA/Bax inhibitor family protein
MAVNTDSYTFLEPIGEISTVDASGPEYFTIVYNTALTITVALALIMIVVAGVEYTTSWASPSAKGVAKTRIASAIGGLILALISYLLLSTINPDLLKVVIPK